MKHLFILIAIFITTHLFAAPMATVEWVKEYIAKLSAAEKEPAQPLSPQPEKFEKSYTSTVKDSAGYEYDVTISLATATNLAIVITESNVPGVKRGSIYAYNKALSTYECDCDELPIIRAKTFAAANVATNISGVTVITTNNVTHFTATDSYGREYWAANRFGIDYLITNEGWNGPKIGYIITTVSSKSEEPVVAVPSLFSLLAPRAYANDELMDEVNALGGAAHFCGNLILGTITIRHKGKNKNFVINGDWAFNSGVGNGTVGEAAQKAFEDWYAAPEDGVYHKRKLALAERATDKSAWGLPDDNEIVNDDNDLVNFYWSIIYNSKAFKDAFDDAEKWINTEYNRIFMTFYNALKEHSCPSLAAGEKYWTVEMECKCRHTYPALENGKPIKCSNAEVSQHDWQIYRLERGSLILAEDGIGCQICARCFEPREDHGAIHVAVPESADWCGCYCGYYYEKKEEEAPPAGAGEGDEIILPPGGIYEDAETIEPIPQEKEEKVEVECTDTDGEKTTLELTIENTTYVIATNSISGQYVPWRHVSKVVRGANGKLIKTTTSANDLMESEVAATMHQKPQDPLRCTCKCGQEHWFKKSPCPDICRGCGFSADCFENHNLGGGEISQCGYWSLGDYGTNLNHNVRSYHKTFDEGYWDEEKYTIEDSEGNITEYIWSNAIGGVDSNGMLIVQSPYAEWYEDIITNGIAACGCACRRFYTDNAGNHGQPGRDKHGNTDDGGHHGTFHCYSLRPVSAIRDPFTRYYYETRDPNAMLPSCSCNNHQWEEENSPASVGEASFFNGWKGSYKKDDSGSTSLACPMVCAFCWPTNHGVWSASDDKTEAKYHRGINLFSDLKDEDVKAAYVEWLGTNAVTCGCLCQALTPTTAETVFGLQWDAFDGEAYHYCDFETSCICACGKMHVVVNPKTYEKYMPRMTPGWTWSRCSKEKDICQLCGFYGKSGLLDSLYREDPDSHIYSPGGGCKCDCAEDGTFAAVFTSSRSSQGPNKKLRGWSVAQDGEDYPNNTRSISYGYQWKKDVDLYHNHLGGKYGCVCSCVDRTLGIVLWHDHDEGEACRDVCKSVRNDEQCAHSPEYYKFDFLTRAYKESAGEHARTNSESAYCGCDCGGKTTQTAADGSETAWHKCAPGECYCYGHYAAGSSDDHNGGESVLVKHIGLAATGNIVTNEKSCASCATPYEQYANEFKCINDHIVLGDFIGGKKCDHRGGCARNCDCCDHNETICECPWCNRVVGAVDYCTCAGSSRDRVWVLSGAKIDSNSILPLVDYLSISPIIEIIGDSSVREIGGDAFNTIHGWSWPDPVKRPDFSKLKSVQFNSVEKVGDYAFNHAFSTSPLLETFELNNVIEILDFGLYAVAPNIKRFNLPKLKTAGTCVFGGNPNLKEVVLPELLEMGTTAFSGCGNLRRVYAPKANMRYGAFNGCTKLEEVDISTWSTNGLFLGENDAPYNPLDLPSGCRVKCEEGWITVP